MRTLDEETHTLRATADAELRNDRRVDQSVAPWHFLNFLPDPHGHGSLRPTLLQSVAPPPAPGSSERTFPAPTTTGSGRAAARAVGGSAGPTSMAPAGSPGGTSSRTPVALYRFVGFGGGGGGGAGSL